MLKALSKSLFFALLLTISGTQAVCAEIKQYQYDGKLPFVQMMLNMMVAMGMLDRVPVSGIYGASGYPGTSWSNLNNPYMRALALRGLSPGLTSSYLRNPYAFNSTTQNLYGLNPNSGYGNNPFLTSPWLQSPWSQPALNAASPVWGSPEWGVLPVESYPQYNYWSGTDLTGWVNEPWETSSWNPDAESNNNNAKAENPSQSLPANSPLVQIYNSTDDTQRRIVTQPNRPARQSSPPPQNSRYNPSPLAKLAPPGYRDYPPMSGPYAGPSQRPSNSPPRGPSHAQTRGYQKPCITDFCGLKKPDLDGFWVAQNGEMLGIKNQQFLWSDGASRYLTGLIKVENEYLQALVEGSNKIMTFKYKLAGNHLLTLQPDGVIREFTRMTANQYYDQYPYDQYQGYGQTFGNEYYP